LPDIDSTESFLGSRIPVLPSAVRMTVGHRGPLHSLAAAITLYLSFSWLHLWIFAGLPPELPLWILAGYVSHLLLDMFNPAGVPLLWPLPRRLGIPLIQTGGVLENLIAFPVVTCLYSFLIYKRMGGAYF
jgi:inner membrane protein